MKNIVLFERVLDKSEFTWELVVWSQIVGRATELRTGTFLDFEEMAAHWQHVLGVYYVEFRTIATRPRYIIGSRIIVMPGDGSMLDMINIAHLAESMGFEVGLPSVRIIGGKVDVTFDMTANFAD